jgi:hypothetical protein
MPKLCFKCHYCPAKFLKLTDLIRHFEAMHRDGEYIEFIKFEVNDDNKGI